MSDSRNGTADRVAGEVRSWLGRRGISARRAAMSLGWTHQYIYRRLSGEIPFSVDELDGLAELLAIPITRFFDWPEEIEREWAAPAAPGRRFISGKDCESWAGSGVLGGREPAAA